MMPEVDEKQQIEVKVNKSDLDNKLIELKLSNDNIIVFDKNKINISK